MKSKSPSLAEIKENWTEFFICEIDASDRKSWDKMFAQIEALTAKEKDDFAHECVEAERAVFLDNMRKIRADDLKELDQLEKELAAKDTRIKELEMGCYGCGAVRSDLVLREHTARLEKELRDAKDLSNKWRESDRKQIAEIAALKSELKQKDEDIKSFLNDDQKQLDEARREIRALTKVCNECPAIEPLQKEIVDLKTRIKAIAALDSKNAERFYDTQKSEDFCSDELKKAVGKA